MQVVFLGSQGAGKGTQSGWLTEYLDVPHLSTGEMLRQAVEDQTEIGTDASSYLAAGRLVPDEIVVRIVGRRIKEPDCARGVLFDGFPRTLHQAQVLDELLDIEGRPIDVVLHLTVDDEQLIKRLSSRGRDDDTPEVIKKRQDIYRKKTMPVLKYYEEQGLLHRIDGVGLPEDVAKRIRRVIAEVAAKASSQRGS